MDEDDQMAAEAHQSIRFNCADCGTQVMRRKRTKVTYINLCRRCASVTANLKHGREPRRLHTIWWSMLGRCQNPNNTAYRYYGAKGIKVCDEWQTFEGFRSWALSNGYADDLTIDRKDNSLGYSTNNCRWVTETVNSLNRAFVKLNSEKAAQIRQMKASGARVADIAAKFRLSRSGVYAVLAEEIWKSKTI